MDLREAVINVSKDWRAAVSGDPNLVDVIFQAHRMAKALGIQLPTDLPTKEVGVRLVEIVDRELIKSNLIRTLSPDELARRAQAVVHAIEAEGLLAGYEPTVKYMMALFTWHGC